MAGWVDSRRRWFGLFFLLVAGGMLVWGETWLKARLVGLGFVLYWLSCLLFTLLALGTALLDVLATRRRIRSEHQEMIRRTFGDVCRERSSDDDLKGEGQ